MSGGLRVLLVEDSADDAEFTLRTLGQAGIGVDPLVVATEPAFREALEGFGPQLILADWSLPGFDGGAAVAIAHAWDPSVPCILVSGTLGEELVVQALRTGATDYVVKQRLEALVPACRRAIAEAEGRRERMRLEADLARSQAALRGALDAMGDPFIVGSALRDASGSVADFLVEYANPAAARFMRAEPAQLIGHQYKELMGAAMPELFGACADVVATGKTFADAGFVTPRPDGDGRESQVVDVVVAPFEDGFFLVFRDVTERTRVARERERLAAVVEQSVDAIAITDPDGRIVYANPAFRDEIGHEAPELLGRSMPEVMQIALEAETIATIDCEVRAGRRWLGEVDQRLPTGATRHMELSVTPGRDTDDHVASVVTVLRDVTQLREAEAELAVQARIRGALAETLHAMPDDATLEETAQAISDQLVSLPFVDVAAIDAFVGTTDVQVVASSAPRGFPLESGAMVPAQRAATIRTHAGEGPWAEYMDRSASGTDWLGPKAPGGLRAAAFGPIEHGGHAVGVLGIGTFDERFARTLVETMPSIISFSATSSGLLGERLDTLRRAADMRAALHAVLVARSFHPVFQPIVDLESGETVGYEALTRFESGRRPDLAFADAWSVGLGPDLEIATLDAAVHAAARLPQGRWLDLNVSPRLLDDPGILGELLRAAGRPLVLEVTEHQAIDDYDAVRDRIRRLGHDIRLAVDDAGAGVANFGHIIELRPDFVKLDISLVRRVNANLGRQAMVVGMRHFSLTAGCRLVAEGVETNEEARTLAALGVEFAQGYWFGRPEPATTWVERESGPVASAPRS